MRRPRDTTADSLGRRPDSFPPQGGVSARSPFVCLASSYASTPSASARTLLRSPSARSSTFSATTATTTTTTAVDDDDLLWTLAMDAQRRLLAARNVSTDSADWKQRRTSATEMVFDRRSHRGEYRVVASTSLPCSAAELSAVLASDRSDELNATLVALLGDVFAFGVTLRELPTDRDDQHLTTKMVGLRANLGPLAIPKTERSVELLDFVSVDHARGRVVRVVQSLRRDSKGRLTGAGDMLVGYQLVEKPAAQSTRVFYYGAMFEHTASAAKEIASKGLLKLAKLLPKMGAIAVRRRFGAQQAYADSVDDDGFAVATTNEFEFNSTRSLNIGADLDACAACSEPLSAGPLHILSKKRRHECTLCGLTVCGSCAGLHEVEERIGMVEKRRICGECVTTLRREAFQATSNPSMCSTVSASPTLSPVPCSRYELESVSYPYHHNNYSNQRNRVAVHTL